MLENSPTKNKLESLRSRGIVPLSMLATRAWILAAISGVTLFFGEEVHEALTIPAGDWSSLLSQPGRLLERFFILVAILSGVTVVVGVLTTMLQTRAASGLTMIHSARRSTAERRAFSLTAQLFLAAALALFGAYLLLPQALYAMRLGDRVLIDTHFSSLAAKVCKLVVVVAIVLAILVMFVSRAAFLFRHRKKEGADGW